MASNSNNLEAQRYYIDTRIRSLLNNDLKEVCKAYGYAVSGTKAVLQKRCTQILDEVVRDGNVAGFDDLRYRVNNRGASPSTPGRSPASKSSPAFHNQSTYPMPPMLGPAAGHNRMSTGGKCFKQSPFYELIETLLPMQDLPEMPQNRHTVKANLTIKPDVAQQIRSGGDSMKILLFCGNSQNMSPVSQTDVAFPNQIEVKINDLDVKHNFKGLKNKPGSTKPADITSNIRKYNGLPNQIVITYALTSKRFAYTVCLVRYVSTTTLQERIKKGSVIPKQKVLDDMSRANADPDIAATSIRMSLKDPVSTMRINLPVRSSNCTHNQCFDGHMFLQMQEQAPQWSCPVCSKTVAFESLCVDKYFEDILNKTAKSIEKVDIEPNGNWESIKEDEDTQPQQNGASSKHARASYDDDFDDDLQVVEIDPAPVRKANGVNGDSLPPASAMPSAVRNGISLDTPPLSSREPSMPQSASSAPRNGNKRPQSAVIDLTLSDDDEDDEPPRPSKRQSTTANNHNTATPTSYNTPASLHDPGYQPAPRTNTVPFNPPPTTTAAAYNATSRSAYTRTPSNPPPPLFPTGPNSVPQQSNPQSPVHFGQAAWSSYPQQQQRAQSSHAPGASSIFPPASPFSTRPASASHQSPAQTNGDGMQLPPPGPPDRDAQGAWGRWGGYEGSPE